MKNNLPANWHVFDSADQVAQKTVSAIWKVALDSIIQNGAFHLVTAGGTTPLQVYRQLSELERKHTEFPMEWSKWHIYMGDERCLPPQDPERNSLALHENWLKNSRIPQNQIHYIPAELGAKKAAKAYEKTISGIEFDAVLLGMGEDGHTASLFPGHNHEAESSQLVQTEFNSPKPPAERVTLSAQCLSNSKHLFKIVTGSGKKEAVKQWIAGKNLPIAKIEGHHTQVFISKDCLP